MIGRHQCDDGCLLGARIKHVIGIGDAKFYGACGNALYDRCIGSASQYLYFYVACGIVSVNMSRIEAAVFGFGEPVECELNARLSLSCWWTRFALTTSKEE